MINENSKPCTAPVLLFLPFLMMIPAVLCSDKVVFGAGVEEDVAATGSEDSDAGKKAAEPSAEPSGGEEESEMRVEKKIVVTAEQACSESDQLCREEMESGRFINAGEAVTEIAGVSAVRRGASATEPVIRGAGYERVATQIGQMPLFGACPARMDPPITYIRSHMVAGGVTVMKGIPSVTLGPAGTGGRILVNPDYERPAGEPAGMSGWVRAGGDGARRGYLGETGLFGGTDRLDYSAAVEALNYGDYQSADGRTVPAEQRGYSGSATLGTRFGRGQRWWNSLNWVKENAFDYPSLPMNLESTDFLVYNTGYRIDFEDRKLERLELTAGLLDIDHMMSNRGKPNRPMLEAETDTDSGVWSGLARGTWNLSTRAKLVAGVDTFRLSRDGLRHRHIVSSGQDFHDHLWPDARQWNLGGFAEATVDLGPGWGLRIGGRLDRVRSDAAAVDEGSLQGMTIREQFVRFYGEEAAEVEATETLPSGNIMLFWEPHAELSFHAGVGSSRRAAGITERYFAFAPAPGGFQLGNPALDAERKLEADAGVTISRSSWLLSISFFSQRFMDYILSTPIDEQDVNGDGTPDLIRGFVNVDARLYGGEATARFRIADHWSMPLSVAYVRGRNITDDRNLPEIPPLEGRMAFRADYGMRRAWWAELGGRFADAQDKVDPLFPENETDGFAVIHFRGGVALTERLSLQAGVENLFNELYNEHLTRETLLDAGDLEAGDEIPAPGRYVYFGVRALF